jgi:hypothetical protein
VATRDQFLSSHPYLANTYGKARKKFLNNHPIINAAWRQLGGAPAPAPTGTYDAGPPVPDPQSYGTAGNYNWGLGYDEDLDAEETQARGSLADLLTQTQSDDNNAMFDWTTQTRAVNENAPTLYRRLLNNFAGRGMAYSSGYNTENQSAHNDVAGQLTNLNQVLAQRQAGNLAARTTAQSNLDALLASIARRKASRQSV